MAIPIGSLRSRLALLLTLVVLTLALAAQSNPQGQSAPGTALDAYPYLFRRDEATTQHDEPVATLLAVGDVMPGRDIPTGANPLRHATSWLRDADLTLGNLEAVIAPRDGPRPSASGQQRIALSAPLEAAGWLRDAGFDLLGLANNHSVDYGPDALAATARHLLDAGITPLGAGPGAASYEPIFRDVRGVRLAFLAFNAVPDPDPPLAAAAWQPASWDEPRALAAVQQAALEADAVVVSLHWGQEYALRAAPWQRDAAQALVDAGADLVLGHHPHVVQEWALPSPTTFAAYSLGNFLFDQRGPDTGQGLALRVQFDRHGLRAVQALPVHAGPLPRLMTESDARPLLARIAPPPPRLAFSCDPHSCYALDEPPPESDLGEGLFWSGAVDLTGDGQPERVRRAAGRLHIYEGAQERWSTPAAWRVVDAALGDPNDDGRAELLVALWQRDAAGHERSQPYIVGFREGSYKVIWGGRPVADPIFEVALGDVDADGAQELVVLEQVGDDETRLALWRWQGWNFSLAWRSDPGPYADLRLAPAPDGRQLITVTRTD